MRKTYVKKLALLIVVVAACAAAFAATASADYGPNAYRQIEVSNNVPGPQGGAAALAVATPALAQPSPTSANPAGQTEARGHIAITRGLVGPSHSISPVDLAGQTEAKGYPAISKAPAGVTPRQTASVSSSRCPCNTGLPGGPAGVTPRQTAHLASSQCPCNTGLPGGPAAVMPRQTARLASSQCPCNTGLPGRPLVAEHVVLVPRTVYQPGGSFDWGDAGAGAGFMAGLGLLAAGVALMLRRHRGLAQRHS
jgi:hypothetical protein